MCAIPHEQISVLQIATLDVLAAFYRDNMRHDRAPIAALLNLGAYRPKVAIRLRQTLSR
jgi:hypothetical protein